MAKILTDADFARFRVLFNDVMETFFRVSVTYRIHTTTLSRFKRDHKANSANNNYTDHVLVVQIIWDDGSEKGQVDMGSDNKGSMDFKEGKIFVAYDDLKALDLINGDGNPVMSEPDDRIVIRTKEYEVTGVVPLGQWKDEEVLVQITFKTQETNG